MIHVKPWAGAHQGLLGGPWAKLQNQQSMSRRLLLPKVPLLTRDIMLRSCQRLIVYTWKNVLRLHPVINTVISIHFLIDMCFTEGKSHYNIMTPHCAGKPLCTSLWQQLIYRMVKALGTLLGKWLMGDVRVYSLCILLPVRWADGSEGFEAGRSSHWPGLDSWEVRWESGRGVGLRCPGVGVEAISSQMHQ